MTKRSFTVPGKPVPQGSMKAFVTKGKAFTTNANPGPLAAYRNDIRNTYIHLFEMEPMLEGTISVTIAFAFKRPTNHFNAAGELKDKSYKTPAPSWHTQKPDIDRLVRATLDALSLYAFYDDAQVANLVTSKRWARAGRTIITVEEVT